MHFSPRQLDALIAAAELGTFTEAAKRLNLTPAAISGQIGDLEKALGFRLFDRTTRKVVLTEHGRDFLPAALAAQRQFAATVVAAHDLLDRRRDIARVAAPLSLASVQLPKLITSFRVLYPDQQIRLLDTGVEWLGDRVTAGEADLAIGPDRIVGPDVIATPLFPSPWVAWCAPDHPMAALKQVRWEDALQWDFYAAGHDHEHSVAARLIGSPGEQLQPVLVVSNISTALGLAAAGLGFTCSPAYVAQFARKMGLVMRPLIEPTITRHVTLYQPRVRKLSPCAATFVGYLRSHWNETEKA